MSRCFPFPPPGYEKKAKTDDVDALIKDKQKEKKHKKEKKDKKKEGKDKDKERSKDKDREKKERKEKHRDKDRDRDRDKDKDKDKDKKRSKDKKRTDENKTEGLFDGSSSSGWKQNESNLQAETFKDTNLLALDRRFADEERGRRDQMVENPIACDTSKDDAVAVLVDKYYDNWVQEKEKVEDKDGHDKKGERHSIKHEGKVVGNLVPSFSVAEQKKSGSAVRPMEKVAENSSVPSFSGAEQKKTGSAVKPMEKVTANSLVPSFSGAEQKKTGNAVKPMEKVTENSLVPSFNGAEQKRPGSTVKPMEKDAERKIDGKEKKKDQGVNDKRKEKHRRRDGEKKSKEKKAEKEKMKEKVKHEDRKEKIIEVPNNHINTLNIRPIQIPQDSEKSRGMEDNSRKRKDFETLNIKPIQIPQDSEKSRSMEDNSRKRKDFETLNIKPIQIPQDSEKSRSMEDNPRKRKDFETNGYLLDSDLSNKLPRPTLPSHPPIANGKKPEPCQPASPFAVPMPRGTNYLRFDKKSLAVNGLIKEKPSPVSTTSLSIPRAKAKENGESSQKPPHPDAKYLRQILTVPKMDDLSDFDDQEWLFSTDSQVKKPKSVSSGVDGSPQVWDRALRIDSADICALPYVIPY